MDRATAIVSVAAGATAVASAIVLALFFVAGGPLGTINDVLNGVLAVLSGYLAWRLSGHSPITYVALLGEVIAIIGSVLVITNSTGFFFAGLVTTVGFALIGVWLVAYCWPLPPTTLRVVGLTAGVLLVLGLAVTPGIAMRLDDMNKAPAWIWIGFVSWLGIYVAFPIWSIWSGLSRIASA
jgi:hypothetical protein